MSNATPSAKSIFGRVLELDTAAEQAAYLQEACAGNAELRDEVEGLLQALQKADKFMSRPAAEPGTSEFQPLLEKPGAHIGPYKLLQQIGEGGMGVVYMAEQEKPVRRRVALKIIKPGMDSAHVLARFEAERQALAIMDHPNIARVLDAGATPPSPPSQGGDQSLSPPSQGGAWGGGRPYFVMELVHGVPLTKYCDENKLSPRDRLELFIPICQAIQHAHQKGIIHRDLKPSNVMVTLHDGRPVPKIIDFGVAKATEQRLTERTMFTQYGTIVGTLEYMAPEQAEMSGLGVDTRSDIYSLGVLLYELLTGSTPLDQKRLRSAAFCEMVRMIKEDEPPRPSLRLSSSGAALAGISQQRGTEPAKLTRLVRGELDWIIMKCLEKDRTRRYETASGLARDLQRYLTDEPVEACPPSAGYRLRKLARKYRTPLRVAAAFVLLLIVGFVLVTWKWFDERAARATAERAQAEAVIARADAERKAAEIREAAARMNEANAIMDAARWLEITRRWPEAEADYNRAIELRSDNSLAWIRRAEMYCRMSLWDLACADMSQALSLHEPHLVLHWYFQAVLDLEHGDTTAYNRLLAKALKRFGDTTDPASMGQLVRLCILAPDAVTDSDQLVRLAEALKPFGGGNDWVRSYLKGAAYYRAGRFQEAVRYLTESLDKTKYVAARALNWPMLAMAHHRLGQTDDARRVLADIRNGIDHGTAQVITDSRLFVPLDFWYDWVESRILYREAHQLIEQTPLPDDPRMRTIRNRALAALGRTGTAGN